jgi:hypothetical protein
MVKIICVDYFRSRQGTSASRNPLRKAAKTPRPKRSLVARRKNPRSKKKPSKLQLAVVQRRKLKLPKSLYRRAKLARARKRKLLKFQSQLQSQRHPKSKAEHAAEPPRHH